MIINITPYNLLSTADFKKYKRIINTQWKEKSRKDIGVKALTELIHSDIEKNNSFGKLLFINKQLKGIVAYNYIGKKNVIIEYLATKEKGYGLFLFKEICKCAINLGKDLYLSSRDSAVGFYLKIGMNHKQKGRCNIMTFNQRQIKKFLKGE